MAQEKEVAAKNFAHAIQNFAEKEVAADAIHGQATQHLRTMIGKNQHTTRNSRFRTRAGLPMVMHAIARERSATSARNVDQLECMDLHGVLIGNAGTALAIELLTIDRVSLYQASLASVDLLASRSWSRSTSMGQRMIPLH